jgi:hypothetical protein
MWRTSYVSADSMLNSSDLTSNFLTISVSLIGDLQTLSHTELLGMFMIYLHTKFHTPISTESLAIAMKHKTKERFRTPTMLSFYILHKYTSTNVVYFRTPVISFQDLNLAALATLSRYKYANPPYYYYRL